MDAYETYFKKAVTFLSYRPRSEKETRDFLTKKQTPQDILEQIISFLTEHKFLNDEEFVKWWIDQRTRFRPKSKKVISIELRQKGVAQKVIEKVLQEASSEGLNDLETAKKLVQKRIVRLQGLPREEIYRKLASFLSRRGFNWDNIKQSIDATLYTK